MGFEQSIHGNRVYAFRLGRGAAISADSADLTRPDLWAPVKALLGWIGYSALVLGMMVLLSACAVPRTLAATSATAMPLLADAEARMDDGYRLPLRVWSGGADPAVVVLGLHGFNDYANAFAPLGRDLAQAGITTYAVDQRGFGATAQAGRWHGGLRLARDLRHLIGLLQARHPKARLYVAGESMGGAVILSALAQGPLPVAGLILIAPAVWSRDTMPWYQRLVLAGAFHTVPWLELTGKGVRRTPSDHLAMLRAMSADPLVIKATRVDALWGITELMDAAQTAASRLQTPALLLYGERDEIIPKNAFCRFLDQLPNKPSGLTLVLYQRGWHMLPRDHQGDRVRADIAAWLRRPESPLPSGEATPVQGDRVATFCQTSEPARGQAAAAP